MTDIEFEILVRTIRLKLVLVARRFAKATGASYDCEDVVQEALSELYQLYKTGCKILGIKSLAVKITKTTCVKLYRNNRIVTTSIEGVDFVGTDKASKKIDLEDTVKLREMLWSHLSPTQKDYLYMRNELGMSLDEIAQKSGHPKASVKASISQARNTMLRILKQYQNE